MSDKTVVRVRIDYSDGTYRELTDPAGCERWAEMAESQAVIAFTRGMTFAPLPWHGSAVDEEVSPQRHDKEDP